MTGGSNIAVAATGDAASTPGCATCNWICAPGGTCGGACAHNQSGRSSISKINL